MDKRRIELTDQQKADLERLRNQPNGEIDTSDAPEILDWSDARRGVFYRPIKEQVTLKLDADVVSWFEDRYGEDECNAKINGALRNHVVMREREAAVEFLGASDEEFDRGDVVEGAKKLWEAAAHAVTAVAMERRWPHEDRRLLKFAAVRLADEHDDPMIAAGFGIAEEFSRHQAPDWMEDWERDADRPLVHDFVKRVLGSGLPEGLDWSGARRGCFIGRLLTRSLNQRIGIKA